MCSGDTLKTLHCSDYEAQNDIQGAKGNVTTLILLTILKGIGVGFGSILESRAGYMNCMGGSVNRDPGGLRTGSRG